MLNFAAKEIRHAEQAYIEHLTTDVKTDIYGRDCRDAPDLFPSDQLLKHAADAVAGLIDATDSMGLDEISFVQEDLESAMQYLAADRNNWDAGFGDVDMPTLEAYAQSLPPVGIHVDKHNQMWAE